MESLSRTGRNHICFSIFTNVSFLFPQTFNFFRIIHSSPSYNLEILFLSALIFSFSVGLFVCMSELVTFNLSFCISSCLNAYLPILLSFRTYISKKNFVRVLMYLRVCEYVYTSLSLSLSPSLSLFLSLCLSFIFQFQHFLSKRIGCPKQILIK